MDDILIRCANIDVTPVVKKSIVFWLDATLCKETLSTIRGTWQRNYSRVIP
jgi:hypothetical protein